jgi:hypothetical protein
MREITNAHKILVEKLERKKSVEKSRSRWRITTKMGLKWDGKAFHLNLSGSGQGPVVLFCEHDIEICRSIKGVKSVV